MRPMTREEVRSLDATAIEEYGIPGIVLMENAGRGATEIVLTMLAGIDSPRVAILCGKGNNGGDGFVMARHLHNRGIPIETFYLGQASEAGDGDAAVNLRIVQKMGLPFEEVTTVGRMATLAKRLKDYDLIVDALLGTGLSGEVRAPLRALIEAINACGKPVLAVDIPSGLDANEGTPLGVAVRATRTTTFAATKVGFAKPEALKYCGQVTVVDIGAPRCLVE